MTDDVLVWDVMVDAANRGCVMTSEGVRLAILAKDAELNRLREAILDYHKSALEYNAAATLQIPKIGNDAWAIHMKAVNVLREIGEELRRRVKEG